MPSIRNQTRRNTMQCYETLAATMLVARIIESLPQGRSGQPVAAVAEWMESEGIAIEDVLAADPATLRAQVAALVDRELRRNLCAAA
jgi:hypothetical protein